MQSLNIAPSIPSKLKGRTPFAEQSEYAQENFLITGTTKDSTGAALGLCAVHLFQTGYDILSGTTTSDASGNFRFYVNPLWTYYVVAYLPGSPDVAGTTINTLVGSSTSPVGPHVPTLVDSYSETNQNATEIVHVPTSDNVAMGQVFTATAVNIGSVKFYLKKTGSPTGNGNARLYDATGAFGTNAKPNVAFGSALAVSDNFDVSTLGTSLALVEVFFTGANQYLMTAGNKYCIVWETRTGTGNASNCTEVGVDNSSPTHGGNVCYQDDGNTGTTWGSVSSEDVCFYVYST
jgi:hypothetical protein